MRSCEEFWEESLAHLQKMHVDGSVHLSFCTVMCAFTSLLVGVWKLYGYEMAWDAVASC